LRSFSCWLRINPDVAKTYGIDNCDGNTTIGSMLIHRPAQLLAACAGPCAVVVENSSWRHPDGSK